MDWIYVALAVDTIIAVIAVGYVIRVRRKFASMKRRIKNLRKRLNAAEIAAELRRAPTDTNITDAKQRYALSPIKPFKAATAGNAPWQPDHPDVLPDEDCDLSEWDATVERVQDAVPDAASRRDIHVQKRRLQREFRGKPGLVLLNALAIVYLRRNTAHTAKARSLFFRLWGERADELAPLLTPRWLLSTLRTFHEHGETEEQRQIGLGGSLYGYMQRVYESERGMSGLAPDAPYVLDTPDTASFGFPGIVTTTATVNDSMNHIHATLIDLSLRNESAGRALEALLTKSYEAPNVFARADQNRARLLGDKTEPQSVHWSFHYRRP